MWILVGRGGDMLRLRLRGEPDLDLLLWRSRCLESFSRFSLSALSRLFDRLSSTCFSIFSLVESFFRLGLRLDFALLLSTFFPLPDDPELDEPDEEEERLDPLDAELLESLDALLELLRELLLEALSLLDDLPPFFFVTLSFSLPRSFLEFSLSDSDSLPLSLSLLFLFVFAIVELDCNSAC